MIFLLTGASCFHMNFKLLDDHAVSSGTSNSNSTEILDDSSGVSVLQILTVLMFVFHILIPMVLLITLHSCLLYYLRNRLRHFFPARTRSARNSARSDDVPAPLLINVSERSEVVRHHSANRYRDLIKHLHKLPFSSSGVWNRHLNKAERHVTYTVTAIVTCYIVSHIPSAFLYVYINLFHDALYSTRWMYTSVQFSTTLVTVSKVLNFILFCMSRSLPLNIIGDSTNNISYE
uniref:G_PROTEIN_RECEP_F1_2 domain-containing protein n=1 Tax=Caenorhabditis japonica TaxID=281687 RepID=A0A8R1DU55_CAEJA